MENWFVFFLFFSISYTTTGWWHASYKAKATVVGKVFRNYARSCSQYIHMVWVACASWWKRMRAFGFQFSLIKILFCYIFGLRQKKYLQNDECVCDFNNKIDEKEGKEIISGIFIVCFMRKSYINTAEAQFSMFCIKIQ